MLDGLHDGDALILTGSEMRPLMQLLVLVDITARRGRRRRPDGRVIGPVGWITEAWALCLLRPARDCGVCRGEEFARAAPPSLQALSAVVAPRHRNTCQGSVPVRRVNNGGRLSLRFRGGIQIQRRRYPRVHSPPVMLLQLKLRMLRLLMMMMRGMMEGIVVHLESSPGIPGTSGSGRGRRDPVAGHLGLSLTQRVGIGVTPGQRWQLIGPRDVILLSPGPVPIVIVVMGKVSAGIGTLLIFPGRISRRGSPWSTITARVIVFPTHHITFPSSVHSAPSQLLRTWEQTALSRDTKLQGRVL